MARNDGLTGLNNRRHFLEVTGHEWAVAQPYGLPLAMMLFDIDRFRLINGTAGHRTGDEILKRVARAASERLRAAATSGQDTLGQLIRRADRAWCDAKANGRNCIGVDATRSRAGAGFIPSARSKPTASMMQFNHLRRIRRAAGPMQRSRPCKALRNAWLMRAIRSRMFAHRRSGRLQGCCDFLRTASDHNVSALQVSRVGGTFVSFRVERSADSPGIELRRDDVDRAVRSGGEVTGTNSRRQRSSGC